MLTYLANDVRGLLASIGVRRLEDLIGRGEALRPAAATAMLVADRGVSLSALTQSVHRTEPRAGVSFARPTTGLNASILEEVERVIAAGARVEIERSIRSTDLAVLARLSGAIAQQRHDAHLARLRSDQGATAALDQRSEAISITFEGSAGQGFAVFLVDGVHVRLVGEANDSVAKGMSGGQVVIAPHPKAPLDPEASSIIGNCALYGATGGRLFVRGRAGDRFAVRNSGAVAVIEGVGMHGCGYMTEGTVVVLGSMSHNIGAGMTGGRLFCHRDNIPRLNTGYLAPHDLSGEEHSELLALVTEHAELTGSRSARRLIERPMDLADYVVCVPLGVRAAQPIEPSGVSRTA
jgi:glutamate synthase domain-containing protein 3